MVNKLTPELMALRAAKELEPGWYVNLGIGLPTLVADFAMERGVIVQSENGVLGVGPLATKETADEDYINAGGAAITLVPGACFFSSADAFAMIRGGHIDVAVLGAYQVSEEGDLANWMVPDRKVGSIGGAMDVVAGAKRVIVLMEHLTKEGQPKLVTKCTYPLTGKRVVNTVITDLAYIEVTPQGLLLKEVAAGISVEQIQELTEPRLLVSPELKEIEF